MPDPALSGSEFKTQLRAGVIREALFGGNIQPCGVQELFNLVEIQGFFLQAFIGWRGAVNLTEPRRVEGS